MIKTQTTEIEILGRKYQYFRSANSEKMFAKKAAEIAKRGDVDDAEAVEYCANLVHQGIKDANINRGFIWKLFNRPPSPDYLMRTLSSNDLMQIVVGKEIKGEADPNH